MDEDKSIRVVLKINPSRHPELYEALNEIESSGRAERLRSLALMALSGYSAANDGSHLDTGSKRSGKAKNKPVSKGRAEEDRSAMQPATALNDEGSAAGVSKEPAPAAEEEEDPHKEVRANVLKGMKNVGF